YSSLNPKMNIGAAIMEPMMVHNLYNSHKGRREKMLTLLEQVGMLPEHADRYPHEFSGGQRQRISIARALGLNPQLLICDESVAALDVSVQSQVLNLLKDLQAEYGLSMLFITHDMSVVNFIADRILVMHKGKVVEAGSVEEVIRNPKEDYTMRLIESIPQWS
ncbi:MAG TPA: ATP-binding cassette domain-containing protein, partial [Saprospiraceae bacterium]|nr:ATP-binding cassette domain-containing protein [Saprospiraceae bacterium]